MPRSRYISVFRVPQFQRSGLCSSVMKAQTVVKIELLKHFPWEFNRFCDLPSSGKYTAPHTEPGFHSHHGTLQWIFNGILRSFYPGKMKREKHQSPTHHPVFTASPHPHQILMQKNKTTSASRSARLLARLGHQLLQPMSIPFSTWR